LAHPSNLRLVAPASELLARPSTDVLPLVRNRGERSALVVLPRRRWYLPIKYTLDFILAILLAIPALPLVLLSALIVKLTSRGPAFYTQIRIGENGRPFRILKIRSMIHNCESLTGPRWSIPGDPRVTWFGHFLRISHLDELPQLLNVIQGEMSLIGPRPERPEFLPDLEEAMPVYTQRLNVRPGVTGLAQIQLPSDTDLHSVERKLSHDLYYVRNVSLWLDIRLLFGTAFYALSVPFAWMARLLRIPDSNTVERDMQDLMPKQMSKSYAA
jgi:lipopolysaccharide/colanic/teichoic acid biosynthesis glycosyltransferase